MTHSQEVRLATSVQQASHAPLDAEACQPGAPTLLESLKQYFGFATFRPLQEQIIQDALAGKDVFALLPTGGGKSLCFQLPAICRPGLTIVVSPLIALMKDQVDGLTAAGISATFLNSTLTPGEAAERFRGLGRNQYRLLYVAPERLMLPGFLSDLRAWKLDLLAIDEAHCISEWGHDFRPEYRQLSTLRQLLPQVPIMALTATATERVRKDIISQLQLREPACYVASFNRPNLTYRVAAKSSAYTQLLELLQARPRESGIVYCQARKSAESLAARLNEDGISAKPYHAGLEGTERARNQELFIRDEVRVICATIAFGMGINKPNVRFVVHYDLPKSIEGYYQETGRAGRDGLPSECLLLFSAGDVVKQLRFLDEKPPQERVWAREQLDQMVHYAESAHCRRRELLRYFSEEYEEDNCQGCDNCLSPRETYDGTLAAHKFLSCLYRVRQQSGFDFGINQIVEVLTGADTESVRKWGHTAVSTYGIGREHSRPEWKAIARQLVRLGFVQQAADKFNVLSLTPEGLGVIKQRKPVTLVRPVSAPEPKTPRIGDIACDEALFERLRQLRKRLADEQGVPPYIVFSDVSLRQMAREYPADEAQFSRISGVGEKKLAAFGSAFLAEIAAHLGVAPRAVFPQTASDSTEPALGASVSRSARSSDTVYETLRRFRAGQSVESIAQDRQLVMGTIYGHLANALAAGEPIDLRRLLSAEGEQEITSTFEKLGLETLGPVFEALGGRYDYGLLKLVRAKLAAP